MDRYVGGKFIQGVPEKNLALNFVDFVPFLIFGTHNTDLDPLGYMDPFGHFRPFWALLDILDTLDTF